MLLHVTSADLPCPLAPPRGPRSPVARNRNVGSRPKSPKEPTLTDKVPHVLRFNALTVKQEQVRQCGQQKRIIVEPRLGDLPIEIEPQS